MIRSSREIQPFFASTKIKEDPEDYLIISIDRKEEEKTKIFLSNLGPWSSVTFDHNEISVVLNKETWSKLRKNFKMIQEEGPFRLLTFDIVLDLSLVGYLSVISGLLAEAGIGIYGVSTYLRDHILVKKKDVKQAVNILEELIDSCK